MQMCSVCTALSPVTCRMSFIGLLGSNPESEGIQKWISSLQNIQGGTPLKPDIKVFQELVYHSYPNLGLSLEYLKTAERITLDAIHIYNRHGQHGENADGTFNGYLDLPITLSRGDDPNRISISVASGMTAKEFVEALGEPSRKGGGQGPSSGSINIWCDWTNIGLMVEFGGSIARGPDAWDQGREAIWKELTFY